MMQADGGRMLEAFRRFQEAAGQLEKSHETLLARVAHLEARLSASHQRLETVLALLPSGVAVLDPRGRILQANPALASLGLVTRGGRLRPSVLADWARRGGAPESLSFQDPRKDGTRHFVAHRAPTGEADGTRVLHVQDVTEARRDERESGRRQRLEALGRMAAELAHEVRNPLGSIRLFAEMLVEDLPRASGERDMAEQILSAVAGLESTVSNLLTFALRPELRKKPVDVVALVRDAVALLAPVAALRGVQVRGPAGTPAGGVIAQADPDALRQVLLNLLGNGLEATSRGGEVAVEVETSGKGACIVVRDTGRGIAEADLPRVFDPFFSRSERGTGLGLSIVHRLMEAHGGTVGIESRPGAGTCVTLWLPETGTESAAPGEAA